MTDMQLGEDLLKQIEVVRGLPDKPYSQTQVKFDAKGTLHVLYREDDGKLIRDNCIPKTIEMPGVSREMELKSDLANIKKKNEGAKYGFYIIAGAIVLALCYMMFSVIG